MAMKKTILRILGLPSLLISIPLVAMRFNNEVNWSVSDFILAWLLMVGVGISYGLVTRHTANATYCWAVGITLATIVAVIWINLAVGIIGSESHPVNLIHFAVLAFGFVRAILVRFEPRAMFLTLLVIAFAQALIPLFAVIFWQHFTQLTLGKLMGMNCVLSVLFAGSALLFRRSMRMAAHGGGDC